jgi:eukaryotic-like serine/threonine-protein kinase
VSGLEIRTARVSITVAILLVVTGLIVRSISERSLRHRMSEELTTILRADVEALLVWLESHRVTVRHFAGDPRIRRNAEQILTGAGSGGRLAHQTAAQLHQVLQPVIESYGYVSYILTNPAGSVLASSDDELVGSVVPRELGSYVERVGRGDVVVSRPVRVRQVEATSASPVTTGNEPSILAAAPVLGPDGTTRAMLAFGISPKEFTRILTVARQGQTGETYAFDSTGLMISESRFDSTLLAIGLLPESASTAVLNIEIRDPGGNLTTGFPLPNPLRGLPLTRMAADALEHAYRPEDESTNFGIGYDVGGYRDYRGVPVVGAWTWLPEYGFGVTTEVDVAEAYRLAAVIRQLLWGIFGLLVLSAAGLLVGSHVLARLRREARQLGQYKLEKRIGEGGIGSVYRARHAMLRRPTAVKLLRPEKASKKTIRRFEREVRHTSRLTHPNTVAIFDYGRTPDGVFYYAMEYLPGVTLSRLIDEEGALPEGRVLHILKQTAASLAEAHDKGLIHRDVKPSNIMLCERGGVFDFVKVLDFGLVRQMDRADTLSDTAVDSITGTPLYLAPEAILDPSGVDARADLYSLGAVGYYLLVGRHVFDGTNLIEVCNHHLNTVPAPPTERLKRPVTQSLESIILRCLAKQRDERPKNARQLLEILEHITDVAPWTAAEARVWWEDHATRHPPSDTWHVDFEPSGLTPTGEEEVVVVEANLETAGQPPRTIKDSDDRESTE